MTWKTLLFLQLAIIVTVVANRDLLIVSIVRVGEEGSEYMTGWSKKESLPIWNEWK